MKPGRVIASAAPDGDPGWLTVRALRHLVAADVLVVDRDLPGALLPDTGAARIPVAEGADAAEAVLHEATRGQDVFRLTMPERWERVLSEEMPVWTAAHVPVLPLPSPRVADIRRLAPWCTDALPLQGLRVLVLRAAERQRDLVDRLEAAGALVVSAPVLEMAAPDWSDADARLARLHRYRWLIFTSVQGVDSLLGRLRYIGGDIRNLPPRLAAVGHATRERLRDYCLPVDVEPEGQQNQDGLLDALLAHGVRGDNVLLARGDLSRADLAAGLRKAGAMVDEAVVYRTVPRPLESSITRAVILGQVDAALATSPSTVDFLLEQLGPQGHDAVSRLMMISIGPTTSRHLAALGLTATAEALAPAPDELVAALVRAVAERGAARHLPEEDARHDN